MRGFIFLIILNIFGKIKNAIAVKYFLVYITISHFWDFNIIHTFSFINNTTKDIFIYKYLSVRVYISLGNISRIWNSISINMNLIRLFDSDFGQTALQKTVNFELPSSSSMSHLLTFNSICRSSLFY